MSWRERLAANPTYTFRSVAAIGAIGITLVGVAPMAVAATDPHADPILARAIDGPAQATNSPAREFSLTDQYRHSVSLADLRGKAIALTFLDPVCTSDCLVVAQEFRAADRLLGSQSSRVEMVAINLNPRFRVSTASLRSIVRRTLAGSPTGSISPGRCPSCSMHGMRGASTTTTNQAEP